MFPIGSVSSLIIKKDFQRICLPDRKGIVHVPVNDPTYSLFTAESCSHFFFEKIENKGIKI